MSLAQSYDVIVIGGVRQEQRQQSARRAPVPGHCSSRPALFLGERPP
jgi:hypothetical protein